MEIAPRCSGTMTGCTTVLLWLQEATFEASLAGEAVLELLCMHYGRVLLTALGPISEAEAKLREADKMDEEARKMCVPLLCCSARSVTLSRPQAHVFMGVLPAMRVLACPSAVSHRVWRGFLCERSAMWATDWLHRASTVADGPGLRGSICPEAVMHRVAFIWAVFTAAGGL